MGSFTINANKRNDIVNTDVVLEKIFWFMKNILLLGELIVVIIIRIRRGKLAVIVYINIYIPA